MKEKKLVLIVEDTDSIRETLKLAMEDHGFRVATARNGDEGVRYLEKGASPSVILLDLMLGDAMSGWGFLEIQKRNPVWKSIPTIAMSAATLAKPPLADAFVGKPIDFDRLLGLIDRMTG